MKRAFGLETIIVYKLTKAVAQTLVGIGAVWLLIRGAEAGAATMAEFVLEHFTGVWALKLAVLLVRAATRVHVKLLAVAMFGDAILSAIEGQALRAGRWWAPWLVVIATSLLLPWEVWELIRHPRWGRVAILVINLAVVAYLLNDAREHHRKAALDR